MKKDETLEIVKKYIPENLSPVNSVVFLSDVYEMLAEERSKWLREHPDLADKLIQQEPDGGGWIHDGTKEEYNRMLSDIDFDMSHKKVSNEGKIILNFEI